MLCHVNTIHSPTRVITPALPLSLIMLSKKKKRAMMLFSYSHSSFPPFKTLALNRKLIPIPRRLLTVMLSSASKQPLVTVPDLTADETALVSKQAFQRYTASDLNRRNGTGVAIVWFRNDLRLLDNEALLRAWASSAAVLPVYCVDPRNFGTTHYFGFPKTGGDFSSAFISPSICFFDGKF